MAVVVASGSAYSVAANTKTSNLIIGKNEYIGRGRIQLVAKTSATGMNYTLSVGGVALIDDSICSYTGTAGTISVNDNVLVDQVVAGGRVELYLRNTTGGALTNDYLVYFTPQ